MNTLLVLQNRAIKAAQEERWEDAQKLNKELLEADPKNLGALNRLGFAYLQSGNHKKAKETYNQVLSIDKTNTVAKKYLKLVERAAKKQPVKLPKALKHSDFIDEPGKTKSVSLVRLADADTIEDLSIGADCELKSTKTRISVKCDGTYIGTLPDDIFLRLQPLLQAGNTYSVKIQSIKNNGVRVFLRETHRVEQVEHIASFPVDNIGVLTLEHGEIVREEEEPVIVSETGEEDDNHMLDNRDIDQAIEGRDYDDEDDDEVEVDDVPDDEDEKN